MINRFIKILLCFLLIIIQISTYANISVSDGSAFVTKSEMSYQLNNLSNRMTQLENSLDSKIDTLVSSYLTRNGVWNGVKQTLNKTQIVDIWNNISAITFSCDYKSQLVTSSLTPGTEYKLRSGSWDLIKKCTKSGMLVGKWTVMNGYDYMKLKQPSVGSDGRNYSYITQSTSENAYNNPVVSNTSECSLWINSKCVFSSNPIDRALFRAKRNREESICFMPKAGVETPMVFVNKDDKIVVDYDVAITPQTEDSRNVWQNRTFSVVGSAPGVAIVFDNFYIY